MPAEAYEFAAEARRELDEAAAFFEGQRSGRGSAFLEAMKADIALLMDYPEAGRHLRGGFRSFALADWPYKIIYTLDDAILTIWAVAHDKRRQGYWRKRMRL
jgi:plasmid stabilization system protein ParE